MERIVQTIAKKKEIKAKRLKPRPKFPKPYFGMADQLPADDERHEYFERQRTEQGFDSTELWSVAAAFAKYLAVSLNRFQQSLKAVPENFELGEALSKMIYSSENYEADDKTIVFDLLAEWIDRFEEGIPKKQPIQPISQEISCWLLPRLVAFHAHHPGGTPAYMLKEQWCNLIQNMILGLKNYVNNVDELNGVQRGLDRVRIQYTFRVIAENIEGMWY